MAKRDNWWRNWAGRLERITGRNFSGDRHAWLVDVIIEAGRKPDVRLLPGLVMALALPDRKLAYAAGERIEVLLNDAPASQLPALFESLRMLPQVDERQTIPWKQHTEMLWLRIKRRSAPTGLLVAVAAQSNGYLREAALRRLDPAASRAARAMVLARLADWVPRVQRRAEALLRRLLSHSPSLVDDFQDLLPLALSVAKRSSAPELSELLARLSTDLTTHSLVGLIGSDAAYTEQGHKSDRALALAHFALAAIRDRPRPERDALRTACLASPRLRVALAGAQDLCAEDPRTARKLLQSKRPELREFALRLLGAQAPEECLRAALFDSTRRLRELAAHLLLESNVATKAELTAAYFAVAFDPDEPHSRRRAALLGLAYTASPDDPARTARLANLARSTATQNSARLAAAAAQTLARLARDRHVPLFVELFPSDSAALSRVALKALLALAPFRPIATREQLLEWVQPDRPAHVRRGALKLVLELPKWASLEVLLASLRAPPARETESFPVRATVALQKVASRFQPPLHPAGARRARRRPPPPRHRTLPSARRDHAPAREHPPALGDCRAIANVIAALRETPDRGTAKVEINKLRSHVPRRWPRRLCQPHVATIEVEAKASR